MLKLTIDVAKFLSLPLNAGGSYLDIDNKCGCIKGNFARATKELEVYAQNWVIASQTLSNAMGNKYQNYNPKNPMHYNITKNEQHLVNHDAVLSEILDRGEHILRNKQRPQFAKLFIVKALRKYGYIEKAKASVETPVLSHA
jgi:hypothetical protein